MRGNDVVGIVGGGFLVAGIAFGITDPKLFDHWYDWVFGPFFWMTGCTLMIAWTFGRFLQFEPYRLKHWRTGFIQAAVTPFKRSEQQPSERRCGERRRGERRKFAA
jgi:hypothetical protein